MVSALLGGSGEARAREPEAEDSVATKTPERPAARSQPDGARQAARSERADEVDQAADPTALDVVVTGKRKSERSFEADRSVTVVNAKELSEAQPRTTPEALWDTPGVFVQETNFGGGSPIVRGLVGPQVLLLFDGVRLNSSVYRTGPLQYLNLIDPLSLSRIEVLRGPGAVLYGSDAMGGVIQLFPRTPRDARFLSVTEAHGRSQLRYASAGQTLGGHAEAEVGLQGFGALLGGTLQSFGDLRAGREVGVQPHSGYGASSLISSLAYRFGEGPLEGAGTQATYLYSRLNRAGRTDQLAAQQLSEYDNEIHLVYDKWFFEIEPLSTTVELTPSFQHFFERKDDFSLADDLVARQGALRDETTVNTFGLDGGFETEFLEDRLALRYGGMFYHDWVGSSRFERTAAEPLWVERADRAYPDDSGYGQYGGYALLEAVPLASSRGHRIQLRGGYRLHGMTGYAPATAALPAVEFSHLGHVFMAAAQYRYGDRASLAFSFTQGFRAPNLQEAVMLGDSGSQFHVPSPGLEPERSNTFELLGRTHAGPFSFFWVGFVSLLDDLLVRESASYQGQTEVGGKPVRHHINADSGLLWGTEVGLGLDLGLGFSVHGQASYAWGEQQTGDTVVPLRRVPPLFGTSTLRYYSPARGSWRGFVETYVRWALTQERLSPEDETDPRIPPGGTPGWWTWNLRIGLSDGAHSRLALAVENLLDATYKYHGSGLYAPGTNAMASYEACF